jgi:hypothetical protein
MKTKMQVIAIAILLSFSATSFATCWVVYDKNGKGHMECEKIEPTASTPTTPTHPVTTSSGIAK